MVAGSGLADHGLRYYPIVGNAFEPRLRGGHSGILGAPVDGFQFDAVYVMRDGSVHRATRLIGSLTVRLTRDNPVYSVADDVPLHWFNAEVEAIGVAEVAVQLRDYQRYIKPAERNAAPAGLEVQRLLEVSGAAA